jgi:hypothetical protein
MAFTTKGTPNSRTERLLQAVLMWLATGGNLRDADEPVAQVFQEATNKRFLGVL